MNYRHSLTGFLLATVLWLAPVAESVAQSGGFAGSFSRIGFAPRGMAMGNAMTAVNQEGVYGYYNPALSAQRSDRIQIDLSSSAMRFDRELHMVNAHFQLPPSAGISVALINGRVGNIDGRSNSGFDTGDLSTNEFQILTNFAIRFSERVWGGIGIKFNLADFHDETSTETGVGFDAGIRAILMNGITFGVAVHDLFATYSTDTRDLFSTNAVARNNDFPTRLTFGLAGFPIKKLLVSADYEIQFLNAEIANNSVNVSSGRPVVSSTREGVTNHAHHVRVGGSYRLHERFTLRSGLQLLDIDYDTAARPTAGFSIHLPFDRFSPSVDYAFMREPSGISSIHIFALRLNL
ncbi:MAG: hypothetical protein ACNA78_01275 [Balneolaceae bacterium]